MAGLFGLSVSLAKFRGGFSFPEIMHWGTFYGQHLGEEFSGFAVEDSDEIWCRTASGLIRPNFGQPGKIPDGTEGIGYCGNSEEPFKVVCKRGEAAMCYSGNLINAPELFSMLLSRNKGFAKPDDIEVIANLLLDGKSWVDGIVSARDYIKGSFSLLVLTRDGIYASVSQDSHWPLIIGRREGAVVVACESTGFSNLGFEIERDMRPGEIILIKDGSYSSLKEGNFLSAQVCKFLWVYTAYPSAKILNVPVSLARKKLGVVLARKDIAQGFQPDIVSFVPDSGRYHGLGYFEEYCRAANRREISAVPVLDMPLQKYPYAGRSYTPSCQANRDLEAHIKIVPNSEDYSGKTLALLEDSVVRGTQIRSNLAPKLRCMGFKGIHIRASNPELLSYCPWGKSTQPGETLADKMPDLQERARYLGVDSVAYNTLDDLKKVFAELGIQPDRLCVDCAVRQQ